MKQEHPDVDAKATVAGTKGKRSLASVVQHDGDEYTAVVMGKCKYCDYANENLLKLKAHVRRYHRKGNAQCPHCPFTAITKISLAKHVNNKHAGLAATTDDAAKDASANVLLSADAVTNSAVTETFAAEGIATAEDTFSASIPTGGLSEVAVEGGGTVTAQVASVVNQADLPTVSFVEGSDGNIIVVQSAE